MMGAIVKKLTRAEYIAGNPEKWRREVLPKLPADFVGETVYVIEPESEHDWCDEGAEITRVQGGPWSLIIYNKGGFNWTSVPLPWVLEFLKRELPNMIAEEG